MPLSLVRPSWLVLDVRVRELAEAKDKLERGMRALLRRAHLCIVHCGSGLETIFDEKHRRSSLNDGGNDDLRSNNEKKKKTSDKYEKKSSQKSGSGIGISDWKAARIPEQLRVIRRSWWPRSCADS